MTDMDKLAAELKWYSAFCAVVGVSSSKLLPLLEERDKLIRELADARKEQKT